MPDPFTWVCCGLKPSGGQSEAGHDLNYLTYGGALSMLGNRDDAPVSPSNILADYAARAQNVIIRILTAIIARQRTGTGQFVDISMMDGVIGLLVQSTQEYFMNGLQPRPGKDRSQRARVRECPSAASTRSA